MIVLLGKWGFPFWFTLWLIKEFENRFSRKLKDTLYQCFDRKTTGQAVSQRRKMEKKRESCMGVGGAGRAVSKIEESQPIRDSIS